MNDLQTNPLVAGERSNALLHALGQVTYQTDVDGMWRFDLAVDPVVGAPLLVGVAGVVVVDAGYSASGEDHA